MEVLQRLKALDEKDGYGTAARRKVDLDSEISSVELTYPVTAGLLREATVGALSLIAEEQLVISPRRTAELAVLVSLVVLEETERCGDPAVLQYPPLTDEAVGAHFRRCAMEIARHPFTFPDDLILPAGVVVDIGPRVLELIAKDGLVLSAQQEAELLVAVVMDCYAEMKDG